MEEIKLKILYDVVQKHTKLTKDDMKEKTRWKKVVEARRVTSVLLRQSTDFSFQMIANEFDLTSHCTIMHYIRSHNDLIETDFDYRKMYEDISNEFYENGMESEEFLSKEIEYYKLKRDEINNKLHILKEKYKSKRKKRLGIH